MASKEGNCHRYFTYSTYIYNRLGGYKSFGNNMESGSCDCACFNWSTGYCYL